jgi:hypothetical protein
MMLRKIRIALAVTMLALASAGTAIEYGLIVGWP